MINPLVRKRRLERDFHGMLGICRDPISFERPNHDRYIVGFKLRSVMSNGIVPVYSSPGHIHRIQINLPPEYPTILTNNDVTFLTPRIFHPNVFDSGKICIGGFQTRDSLARFVIRLAKMIQFDPAYINSNSPANPAANEWYVQNLSRRLFPVDRTKLPDPDPFANLSRIGNSV